MSSNHESHAGLTFAFARSQDAPVMQAVLTGIVQRMPDPTQFALLSDAEMAALTGPEGFSILALTGQATGPDSPPVQAERIAAMIMIRTQALDPHLTDMLLSCGMSPESTALMDVVAVHEQHRGRGLMAALSQLAEEELRSRGFTALVATVHPDNVYSLNNFKNTGYHVLQEGRFYGGQRRYLVCKTLAA